MPKCFATFLGLASIFGLWIGNYKGSAAIIISSVWNVIMTLLLAVLVVAVVRYLFLLFTTNKLNSFANTCDQFFIPLSSRIASVFIKNASSSYQLNLIISIIVLTVLLTAGSFGITYLTNLLLGM